MKKTLFRSVPAIVLLILAIVLLHFAFNTQFVTFVSAQASSDQLQYLVLNSDPESVPLGMVYDSARNKVYVAEWWFKGLYVVDAQTLSVEKYLFAWGGNPWNDEGIKAYGVAVAEGKLFVAGSYDVGVFNPETASFSKFGVYGRWGGIVYYAGFIWVCGNDQYGVGKLLKILPSTGSVVETFIFPHPLYLMDADGNYLWISATVEGEVYKFNIQTGVVEATYQGFNRPLGIETDATYVYVAENEYFYESPNYGKIARINKSTGVVDRLNTWVWCTQSGPYGVMFDQYNNLWFTDNSGHMGVVGKTSYPLASPYGYFLCVVQDRVWGTVKASAEVAMVTPPTVSTWLSVTATVTKYSWGTKIVLSGYLKGTYKPSFALRGNVADAPITVTSSWGQKKTTTTSYSGYFWLSFTVSKIGTYKFTIRFAGDKYFLPCSTTVTVTVT